MKDKDLNRPVSADAEAADRYPGVAVDHDDHNDVDPKLVKERTRTLNNNPRNNKLDE